MTTTTESIPPSSDVRPTPRDLSRLRAPTGSARGLLRLRRVAIASATLGLVLAIASTFAALVAEVVGVQPIVAWHEVGSSASGALAWTGLALRGLARRGGRRDRIAAIVVLIITMIAVLGAGGTRHYLPVGRVMSDGVREALTVGTHATGVPGLVGAVVLLVALGTALVAVEARWSEPAFAVVLVVGVASLYAWLLGASDVLLHGALRTIPPLSALTATALSVAGLAASQGRIARTFVSHRVDGAIVRRVSPIVLLAPGLLGLALSRAMRLGLVSVEEWPLLFVVPSAVIGIWVVVVVSSRVERLSARAQESELRRRDEARTRMALRRRSILDEITAGFSKALDPADVVRVLAEGPMVANGLRHVAVQWSGGDHDQLRVTGWDERSLTHVRAMLEESVASGSARYLEGRSRIVEAVPELVGRLAGEETWIVVPMTAFGHRTGALALCIEGLHRFDDEERSLAHDLGRRCGEALERARVHAAARDLALQLGRGLTPTVNPHIGCFDLAAMHRGTELDGALGGDWYDAFALDAERVCVTVGDVEGRGLGAASVMGEVRTALRLAVRTAASPAEALHVVNQALSARPDRRMVRATVAVLGPEGVVSLSSAGMPPPLRCLRMGPVGEVRSIPSLPLGVHASATFEDIELRLVESEALFLHTDGIVSRRGESLGDGLARLRARLDDAGSEPSVLIGLAGELLSSDDEAAAIAIRPASVDARASLHLQISQPGELATLRRRLRRWLVAADADDQTIDDLVLCLTEAVTNALDHADVDADRPATVAVRREPDAWVMEVSDEGAWRPDFAHSGGRGMQIMSALAVVDVLPTDSGKQVRMRRPASAGPISTGCFVDGAVDAAGDGCRTGHSMVGVTSGGSPTCR